VEGSRNGNDLFLKKDHVKRFLGRITLIAAASALLICSAAGASKESRAATLYTHYFNVYMYAAFDKGIREQNSSIPSTVTAGIRLEIAAINHFDSKIQTIKFPSSDKTALNHVLNADAVQTSLDGTLAINTTNTSNYNSLFPGVETAGANSTAAIDALAKKLGMNWH
jgi:hypothetical protein